MATGRNDRGIRKFIGKLVNMVCFGIMFFSSYQIISILYDYYANRQVLAEIQEVYQESRDGEDSQEGGDMKGIRSSFTELLRINPDIVGWIEIPGTDISYPVLQAENNEFYLTRNYKKEKSRAGSIFMDYRNDVKDLKRNVILYGHRMKDDSMFGQLDKYLSEPFFRRHRTIYFDTLYESYDAEVFAVYKTTTDFYYIDTDFSTDEEYLSFVRRLLDRSVYKTGLAIGPDDPVLTLSTCDYTFPGGKGRLVIHARLKKKM
ncbi:class B sortase [Caldibacillus debilis]|jgi:sortase B|uniref:Sortase B n=1 Tax=Caldibacillus debilis GB1 TaxID=1339248 RepID=A0A420VBW7_9BACI|nr:class B sortase [Caldibacillus debilis]RKO61050.1 sortase B [Caldibacillus debilis GB1]